jgi:hypothetical protein
MSFTSIFSTEGIKVTIKAKPGSVGGAFERKFEKLLVFGAISTRCDEATAQAIREGDAHAIVQYYHAVEQWIDFALLRVVSMCAETLKSPETWREFVVRPEDFNKALDKVTRGASIALKLLHRIPDHRPSENGKRDKELFRLKTEHDADWSFGKLAMHYNHLHPKDPISDKQAERSYKQECDRLRAKIERAQKAAEVYLEASSLSPEQLANELPTPQFILDILTTNK